MSAPKTERNHLIHLCYAGGNGWSMTAIALHFGLSHSRVREILGKWTKVTSKPRSD